jgi:hypothetical protein
MVPVATVSSSSDGQLTSDYPSLLIFTAAMGNLMSDYSVTAGQIQIYTYM